MVQELTRSFSLDERIVQELKDVYKAQQDEGKLPSKAELEHYYVTFRNRFGPEKLKNLDGEVLLETMHSLANKNSLAYWLEFKNDEEFPALFGSIAGGSAFKFGLFCKKETGIWMTGASKKPTELSVEQAIQKARRHRDQFIAGAELLANMPSNASDEEYKMLQEEMDHVAPDIVSLGWAHKYFSLLYPKKLDDYHRSLYQRFHLIKLLQMPPHIEGMYAPAGRYVAIAHALNMPLNTLTTLLNSRNGSPHQYWRVGTRSGDAKKRYWEEMRNRNFCAIGWPDIHDLSALTQDEAGRLRLRDSLKITYPDDTIASLGKVAKQLFAFRWTIAIGDLILASDGATVLGIGRVTGDYVYDASLDFPHQRSVEWLSLDAWKQPDFEGKLTALHKMKKDINLLETERQLLGITYSMSQSELLQQKDPLHISPSPLTGISKRIQSVLERKGQVILYGPPGTGKTYWAQVTAQELAARANFHKTYAQLTPFERSTLIGDSNHSRGNIRWCCFHPAYGYEDFLEGLRPETANGQFQFVPRDGIFKQLCKDALASPHEKFYLVIDEINRGEIPRIFGELLTVLEKDQRGKVVLLPLTGQAFQVPNNLSIIGTMNTADRSIALLDTALRRRFGFIELMPDTEPLKNSEVGGIPLGPWLEALNQRICECVGHDARNLQIGHAYLLEKGQPIADFATFARVVQDDILPLLEEYCYEDYSKLEKILGSGLVDVKTQQIRHELFDASRQANLVQALLAPYPDITTSARAIWAEAEAEEQQNSSNDEDENGFGEK